MNILFIARGYPSEQDPIWGNFERDQALALQSLGHNITIMSVDGRFRLHRQKFGISHFKDNTLSIYSIFYFPLSIISIISRKLKMFVREKMTLRLYKKILKDGVNPEIIYAHYLINIESCRLIKKKYNTPIVGIEHWSEINKKQINPNVIRLGKYGYSVPDKLLTVSISLQRRIKQVWGYDSEVIPNMVDKIFFQNNVNRKPHSGCIKFISIGSLTYGKGYDLLIRAFDRANIPLTDWTLYIIGGGSEKMNLQKLINKLGLNNNIYLLGRQNREIIKDLLLESDCFVLASRGETFGVVYIEAMAVGLPVIGTKCGGPEEIINQENGLLIPSENIDEIAKAIVKMMTTARQYDSNKIITQCYEKYSSEKIACKLERIFNGLILK